MWANPRKGPVDLVWDFSAAMLIHVTRVLTLPVFLRKLDFTTSSLRGRALDQGPRHAYFWW